MYHIQVAVLVVPSICLICLSVGYEKCLFFSVVAIAILSTIFSLFLRKYLFIYILSLSIYSIAFNLHPCDVLAAHIAVCENERE